MCRVILKNSLSENFWKFRGEGWWRVCSGRFLRNFSILLQHSLTEDSPGDFLGTRCSYKFCKIYRKATVPELLFNKVTTYLIKLDKHRCLPVNFAKSLRTRFLKNTSGPPFLNINLEELIFHLEFCLQFSRYFTYNASHIDDYLHCHERKTKEINEFTGTIFHLSVPNNGYFR